MNDQRLGNMAFEQSGFIGVCPINYIGGLSTKFYQSMSINYIRGLSTKNIYVGVCP